MVPQFVIGIINQLITGGAPPCTCHGLEIAESWNKFLVTGKAGLPEHGFRGVLK